MQVLQATIGRNIGESPMSDLDWRDFRVEVRGVLETFCAGSEMFLEEHLGRGEWTDEKTGARVYEESAKIAAVGVDGYDSESVERALSEIAAHYEQDAIALVVAPSVLIGARKTAPSSLSV